MDKLPEIVKQDEFYKRVGINPDLHHSTDGVDRGNLYENKLNITDINEVLSQAIKYASRIRIRGERLPANIILNDLTTQKAYIFQSKDLLSEIEQIYFGAASKDNKGRIYSAKHITIQYGNSIGLAELLKIVNSENFTKYHIDRTNIFGLSQQFYKFKQDKDSFLKGTNAEIRKPFILKDRIIPYTKSDNLDFKDIMDCLNPALLQREQGAYYTPSGYVRKMHEMLLRAISEVPKGMDYVIIDRCAGVGNLEEGLPDEILSHCVLSTIEPNEYQILLYRYAEKSAVVIPDTDALAYDIIPAEREFMTEKITNDYVRDRVNDPNCVVILVENPPFSEAGSGGAQKTGRKENKWKQSLVMAEMKKEINGKQGVATNDLSNLFIWSGFKYYLTKPTDSYILYSPTKYWRNQNLVKKKFVDGFLCNRKEFHAAQNSAMGCIWWKNEIDEKTEKLTLTPYDIVDNKTVVCKDAGGDITLRKTYYNMTYAYDKRDFDDDVAGIMCERDGKEFIQDGRKIAIKPLYNENIIGYMDCHAFLIDRKTACLIRAGLYYGHGFYLRLDNFLEKLPLFVAAIFPYDKWWKTDVYSKTYDGKGKFITDNDFLRKCLIYTCLTPKNKCRSFQGSDGRFYRNELCFENGTLASKTLKSYTLSSAENTLMKYWDDVMFEAKKTEEYDAMIKKFPNTTFGLWQVMEELNVKISVGKNREGNDIMKPKYAELNTEIIKIDSALKRYYADKIIPDLFRYELIK